MIDHKTQGMDATGETGEILFGKGEPRGVDFLDTSPTPSRIDAFFWLEHRHQIVEAIAKAGFQILSSNAGFIVVPLRNQGDSNGE